jgi:hypothetical protein
MAKVMVAVVELGFAITTAVFTGPSTSTYKASKRLRGDAGTVVSEIKRLFGRNCNIAKPSGVTVNGSDFRILANPMLRGPAPFPVINDPVPPAEIENGTDSAGDCWARTQDIANRRTVPKKKTETPVLANSPSYISSLAGQQH